MIDITIEELDNALLGELSPTDQNKMPGSGACTSETNETTQGIAQGETDFLSEVRKEEQEIHAKVARTARVNLTSSNLNLAMARNMLNQLKSEKGYFYVPEIKSEQVQRVLLSYFYFVRLKDEDSCKQLQGR